jgi:hypothetical protein
MGSCDEHSGSRDGSDGGGSARTTPALSRPTEYTTKPVELTMAMVPSFRLAEQTAKTRALKAENDILKARIAELEAAMKSKRDEFVFRRGKRAS